MVFRYPISWIEPDPELMSSPSHLMKIKVAELFAGVGGPAGAPKSLLKGGPDSSRRIP